MPPCVRQLFNARRQHVSRTHNEPRRTHPVPTIRNRKSSAQCQCPIYTRLFPQAHTATLAHQALGMHDARCPIKKHRNVMHGVQQEFLLHIHPRRLYPAKNDGSSGFDHNGPEPQQSSEAVLWWPRALKSTQNVKPLSAIHPKRIK